jgi:hypothetical protein
VHKLATIHLQSEIAKKSQPYRAVTPMMQPVQLAARMLFLVEFIDFR